MHHNCPIRIKRDFPGIKLLILIDSEVRCEVTVELLFDASCCV